MLDRSKKKSMRSAYGNGLVEAGNINENVVVLDADVSCSTQTAIFAKEFPQRFFNMGIAEQDMVATAVGLASQGKIPFATTFAVFATGRTYDQIRNGVCYSKFNVKIVGTHGGITVGEDGATHQALEDVSLMRSIPNMTVIVPADYKECEEAVKYAASHEGPMYIRVARSNVVEIFDENYKFDLKAKVLKQGIDISIISNGETLAEVLDCAELLEEEGINAQVINMPVVKPLDDDTILKETSGKKLVVTVENHSIIGGIGSAVCELLSEKSPKKVLRLGMNDEFGQSGDANLLMEHYGLTAQKLKEKIIKNLKEIK